MTMSVEHSQTLQPFTINGDVSKWVNNSRVRQKTTHKPTKCYRGDEQFEITSAKYLGPIMICLSQIIDFCSVLMLQNEYESANSYNSYIEKSNKKPIIEWSTVLAIFDY